MENLEPTTDTGRQLHFLLTSWESTSPEIALNYIHRILFMYASKIKNPDSFVSSLYGQGVLKKRPCVFMKKFSKGSKVFGVQRAIGICLKRNRGLKKLTVALEWSENDQILTGIFKGVEQQVEMKNSSENCPPVGTKSKISETVVADINMEATHEPETLEQDVEEARVAEIPSGQYQCRFEGCRLHFSSQGGRRRHYKNRHNGQCAHCGETGARFMYSTYEKKCCNSPCIIGGPFYCFNHCRKMFMWMEFKNHLKEISRSCQVCGQNFGNEDEHSC